MQTISNVLHALLGWATPRTPRLVSERKTGPCGHVPLAENKPTPGTGKPSWARGLKGFSGGGACREDKV